MKFNQNTRVRQLPHFSNGPTTLKHNVLNRTSRFKRLDHRPESLWSDRYSDSGPIDSTNILNSKLVWIGENTQRKQLNCQPWKPGAGRANQTFFFDPRANQTGQAKKLNWKQTVHFYQKQTVHFTLKNRLPLQIMTVHFYSKVFVRMTSLYDNNFG